MQLSSLIITCKQSEEKIEFCPQVNYFHGIISAGKSTIANLIDFCFGGDLLQTPAVKAELVSVALSGEFGKNNVLIERMKGSNQLGVSWTDSDVTETLIAPVNAGEHPILEPDIFNISDLLFYFLGMRPIKMRKNQRDPEAEMVRLGFRDVMKFCYLQQKKLDSSFYDLNAPVLQSHGRIAMRFFVGYYSEALNDLEQKLAQLQSDRKRKVNSITEISGFLKENGIKSSPEIEKEITTLEIRVREAENKLSVSRSNFGSPIHLVDQLKDRLRTLSSNLELEKNALSDIKERTEEQRALRAELITTRMKLARAQAASTVLSGVIFESCPCCGKKLHHKTVADECTLCGQEPSPPSNTSKVEMDIDLKARISELDDSIRRHQRSQAKQEQALFVLSNRKADLDARLRQELTQYDSDYLAACRELERTIASLTEQIRALRYLQRLPAQVNTLEQECDSLKVQELQIQRLINQEKENLGKAEGIIGELESEYAELLRAIKYPGMGPADSVSINRTTFIPSIMPDGDSARAFTFDEAGSAGKSTLLNVCFGLALHLVGTRRNLPIPHFLMIDSPMKNISADVNKQMFTSFFERLYELAAEELRLTQFIIIENDYVSPTRTDLSIKDRLMTQDDPNHPPLISYYRGH